MDVAITTDAVIFENMIDTSKQFHLWPLASPTSPQDIMEAESMVPHHVGWSNIGLSPL